MFARALFALLVSLVAPLPSQAAPVAPDVVRAIADWQAARAQDEPAPSQVLARLGRLDAPAVTELLLQEARDQRGKPLESAVLRALGERPRPGAQAIAMAALVRDDASMGVREVAARTVARQGSAGIDALLDLARPDQATREPVRAAALAALGGLGDERAWRGMAPFVLQGTSTDRLRVLRLLDGARDIAVVSQARVRLLGEQNLELVALAWRQLAQESHARAADAVDDVLEKAGQDPAPAVRGDLVLGLAALPERDHWPALLKLAAHDAAAVRQAVKQVAPRLAADAAFVAWLAKAGLGSDAPLEREVAMQILRAAPGARLVDLLGDVRARLRRADPRAVDIAVGLHDVFAKDPTWQQDLLALARANDSALRVVGLHLLLLAGSGDALDVAQGSLDRKEWELRSLAIRYLTRFRDPSSIPLLIARCDREDGRVAAELNHALFVHTGTRCWKRSEWEAWWGRNRPGFAMPPLAAVASAKAGGGGGRTVSYFDIPLVSHRIAFVVDVSGSMQARVGTGGNRSRLDEAKRQLERAIEALAATCRFNVIVYETGVRAVWEKLVEASARRKQEALAEVRLLRPMSGTNIHDALELAFADPAIDTIYLLTDGQPSAGKIVDIEDLIAAVRRWNLRRQVVVHGISLGLDSELLKRLAADSGGSYVHVK